MAQAEFWPVYTVYSGGDDLLLAGPWDVMVKFAIRVNDEFRSSLGKHGKHGLTISAGLAFTKPKIPLRHAVERADELLEKSKKGTKDQCACLDAVLRWDRFVEAVGSGRKIAKWIEDRRGYCPRSLVQRLYRLATGKYQNKAGLWAWQVGRNFPPRRATGDAAEFRQWGLRVLDDVSPGRMQEVGASLLYALTATRGRREQDDG
jgi:CRISPR-associated protein Csm1